MSKKLIISHPDTLQGFAAAFAAWCGLWLHLPPNEERPEVVVQAHDRDWLVVTHADGGTSAWPLCHGIESIWEDLVPDFPAPEVLRYVGDTENLLPGSRHIRAFIASLRRDKDGLLEWLDFDRYKAAFAGEAILRFAKLSLGEQKEYLEAP